MYTAFYGLREKPFSLTPNPRFLYLADSHREAMAHLLYGLEQGEGFIVITGEVGTGKTTLCRSLLDRIEAEAEIAILFNPSRSALELLQSINEEFGLPAHDLSRRQLLSSLNRFLVEQHEAGRKVVLIIDEAQNLSPGTLEQVRLLSNLETESSKLIQIILLGQPELDEKLDSDSLRQLRQRVSVRWRLEALPLADTMGYVRHRIRVAAGADRTILTEAGLREIHRQTGGVPRLINVLADRALLAGYAEGTHSLGPALIRKAAKELPASSRPDRSRLWWAAGIGGAALAAAVTGWLIGANLPGESTQPAVSAPPSNPPIADATPAVSARPPAAGPAYTAIDRGPGQSSAAVVVAPPRTATPLENEEAWIGMPGDAEPLLAPPEAERQTGRVGQGAFLAALLSRQDSLSGRVSAGNAVLGRFGMDTLEDGSDSFDGLVDTLVRRGLNVTPLPSADLGWLPRLDYPALLPLRAATGEIHTVAVVSLADGIVELIGAGPSGSLRVPVSAVDEQWLGEGYVVWRPYLEVPPVITYGDEGAGVLWVQEALQRLGDFRGAINGEYDDYTARGVRRFQRRHGLEADGVTGPLTQMLLYGELDEYSPPRLAGDAG